MDPSFRNLYCLPFIKRVHSLNTVRDIFPHGRLKQYCWHKERACYNNLAFIITAVSESFSSKVSNLGQSIWKQHLKLPELPTSVTYIRCDGSQELSRPLMERYMFIVYVWRVLRRWQIIWNISLLTCHLIESFACVTQVPTVVSQDIQSLEDDIPIDTAMVTIRCHLREVDVSNASVLPNDYQHG